MVTLRKKLAALSQDVQIYNEKVGMILKYSYRRYRTTDEISIDDPIRKVIGECNERFADVMRHVIEIEELIEGRKTNRPILAKVYKQTERIISSTSKNLHSYALNFCLRRAMSSAGYEIPKLIKEIDSAIKRNGT